MIKPTHLARRMRDIQPFHVMDLLARARALEEQGEHVIHLEVGEPDFSTAGPIVAAGRQALAAGLTHYTPAVGLSGLRQAIARYYLERYGVEISAERIIVTPGASGALQLALGVLLNPGDQVLLADPGYPCNRHFVRLFEGEAVAVPVGPETAYQLTPALLERYWSKRTVAVLIASPSNPTGTLIDIDAVREMAALARLRGGCLIADEIYHGLVYDTRAQTALSVADDIFVINSFSKYFGMTGWRLGWIVAPEAYVREVDKLAQNIFLAAPTVSQHAALAAFGQETIAILEARRAAFRERRDYLLPALRDIGFEIPVTPEGAFYVYANSRNFSADSYAFSNTLLEQANVAITPGIDFGTHDASSHVRFAYTTSMENLREGVARLRHFLSR